mmetsp:Transcript_19913/g.48441  ORF Transcript_19913/g.48441 Transcript_19913/m.48441 type:complete len:224 (+) Transcript_19913:622-1293(+)
MVCTVARTWRPLGAAIGLMPRAAAHAPSLLTGAARRRTRTPLSCFPTSLDDLCGGPRHGDGDLVGAVGGLLAHHCALRLRAVERLAAMPLALWLVALSLATVLRISTVQPALWLLAACGALWARQNLGPVAAVVRAKHGAIGLITLHLACIKSVLTKLWALRFALRDRAMRLAVLLADRLRTIPSAMWKTALSIFQRHNGRVVGRLRGGVDNSKLPDNSSLRQ